MAEQVASYEDQLLREMRSTPREYWPSVVRLVRVFRESVSLKPAEESLRVGLAEAASGQTRPVSELWEGIGAD